MSHVGDGKVLPCVAGGVVAGFGVAMIYSHLFGPPSFCMPKPTVGDASASGVWKARDRYTHPDGTPDGFTMCQVGPDIGVDCFLEKWEANTSEPAHSHPGDDSTTVVEGEMVIQFYTKQKDGSLLKDGQPITLKAGQTGMIKANRIHDVRYTKKCKLIYVHNTTFAFNEAG